jgi:hypothetical protein
MQPITIAEAEEMGAPACFADEYAFHERNGTLPPYSGPVYPDYGSDARDLYDDYDPEPSPPQPCQGPPPVFVHLGMPPRWRQHEMGCWDIHARVPGDVCPPPF